VRSSTSSVACAATSTRAGRTQQTGTLEELRGLTRTTVRAEVVHEPTGFGELPGVHGLEIEGHRVHMHVDTVQLDGVVRRLGELGVRSLECHPPTLEELFLRHYGDELAREGELSERLADVEP
jgi:ABC-2 type transport system ATP-binding protein